MLYGGTVHTIKWVVLWLCVAIVTVIILCRQIHKAKEDDKNGPPKL